MTLLAGFIVTAMTLGEALAASAQWAGRADLSPEQLSDIVITSIFRRDERLKECESLDA